MNHAGFKIPYIQGVTLKGADNQNYIVNAAYMKNYLEKHYGGAKVSFKNHSRQQNGIPYFRGPWTNASGHVDVINNGRWGSCYKNNGSYYKVYDSKDNEIFCQGILFR